MERRMEVSAFSEIRSLRVEPLPNTNGDKLNGGRRQAKRWAKASQKAGEGKPNSERRQAKRRADASQKAGEGKPKGERQQAKQRAEASQTVGGDAPKHRHYQAMRMLFAYSDGVMPNSDLKFSEKRLAEL